MPAIMCVSIVDDKLAGSYALIMLGSLLKEK
jgi:hypothetical protein